MTPIWVYVFIPILSAMVGYVTNVIAIWMTFAPTELWPYKLWQPAGQPLGLFGWQVWPLRVVATAAHVLRTWVHYECTELHWTCDTPSTYV